MSDHAPWWLRLAGVAAGLIILWLWCLCVGARPPVSVVAALGYTLWLMVGSVVVTVSITRWPP